MAKKTGESKRSLIGIDITGSYISLVAVNDSVGSIVINKLNTLEIPPSSDKESRTTQIIKFLKESFLKIDASKYSIFSILSGSEVIIRRISLPKMKEKELQEAVKWEIKSHVPFPVDSAVISYSILSPATEKSTEKLDLLVVAVQQEAVDVTKTLFEAAGVKLDGITVAPFALWNLLKKLNLLEKDKTSAIINMGADTTKIIFFNGENLEFFRELSLAGNSFTKAMIGLFVSDKWQMNMDYDQAEHTKRLYGIPDQNSTETTEEGVPLTQIYQVLRSAIRRFMNEVSRSFGYYKEQFSKPNIDRIYLAGGSSKLKNIDKNLSAELETTVEKLDAMMNIKASKDVDEIKLKDALPHLAVTLGTALSQAKEINLMKKKKPAMEFTLPFGLDKYLPALAKAGETNKMSSSVGIAAAVIFLIGAFALNMSINNKMAYYTREMETKKVILANLKALSQKQSVLAGLQKQQSPVRQAIAELTNLLPNNTLLSNFNFSNPGKIIGISGTSSNINNVGELLKRAEASPFFSVATLIETKKTGIKKEVTFRIALHLDL